MPGPSKKRLRPSDKRVQSERPSKRKRDADQIDEDYRKYLSGLITSGNSSVFNGKDGDQHGYDESADGSSPEQISEAERGEERVQSLYLDNVEGSYLEFLSGLRISRDSLVYEGKDGKQFRYEDEFSDQGRSDSHAEGSHRSPISIGRMTPEHRSEGEWGEERVHDHLAEPYYKFLSGLRISGDSLVYRGEDGKRFRYDDEFSDQSRSDFGTEGSHGPPPSVCGMTPAHRSEGERGEERVQTPYHDHVEEPYYEFLSGLRISGDFLVYEGKDGKQFKYDQLIDQSRSDSGGKSLSVQTLSSSEEENLSCTVW